MKKLLKSAFSALLALLMLVSLTACGGEPTAPTTTAPTTAATTVPQETAGTDYYANQDEAFLPKDIFTDDLWRPGFLPNNMSGLVKTEGEGGAYVISGEYGKCYEVKIPAGSGNVIAFCNSNDPATRELGDSLSYNSDSLLFEGNTALEGACFMYTCRTAPEYLVIYMETKAPIYVGERTILAETDTLGPWYIPESVGSADGDCTFANYKWDSETVINNLYEPLREKYPDYITREVIGTDQTGEYTMYGYIFAPENYETTLFLTGGMHANEETAYLALAKCIQLIADADENEPLLYQLRSRVRLVVVPIINVWGVSQDHSGVRISRSDLRNNGTGQDLNRDFGNLSQKESQNVMAYFARFADEAKVAMDFHTAGGSEYSMWYNFINFTDNAVANYKTVNHMYHRYVELGYADKVTDLTHIPGSYEKNSKYIEGRIWNEYGVPTITVEHVVNSRFPTKWSDKAMTIAVENFMNFILQNGLFYLQ